MKLELFKTYTIVKNNNSTVTFKFIGGEPPMGLLGDGTTQPLLTIIVDTKAYCEV